MPFIVGVVSQKGGVGKSTICQLVSREYAAAGWDVKIADLDTSQATCTEWKRLREQHGREPLVAVEPFGKVKQAQKHAQNYDLLIFDAPPHSTTLTLDIAQISDLLILPTGLSLADLRPAVLLGHELVKKSIPKEKIVFTLCRVGDRENEINEARDYIQEAGYTVLDGELPERTGYRRAYEHGQALTESPYPGLRERAERFAKSIVNKITAIQE